MKFEWLESSFTNAVTILEGKKMSAVMEPAGVNTVASAENVTETKPLAQDPSSSAKDGPKPDDPSDSVKDGPTPENSSGSVKDGPTPENSSGSVKDGPTPENSSGSVKDGPTPENSSGSVKDGPKPENPSGSVKDGPKIEDPSGSLKDELKLEDPSNSVKDEPKPAEVPVSVTVSAIDAALSTADGIETGMLDDIEIDMEGAEGYTSFDKPVDEWKDKSGINMGRPGVARSRRYPFFTDMLAYPNSVLMKVFKAYFGKCQKPNIVASLVINDIRGTATGSLDLPTFLKKMVEIAARKGILGFPALKSNAVKIAKLDMASPEVWVIKAFNVPFNRGKKNVREIFEKYGRVLEVFCAGSTHPLDTVEVAMETAAECQNAIDGLNGISEPGLPNNVMMVTGKNHVTLEDKQNKCEDYQKQWKELNEMLSKVVIIRAAWKHAEILDEIIEMRKTQSDVNRKAIVGEILKSNRVTVIDECVEHEDWKDDADFVAMVKRKNTIYKAMWEVKNKTVICHDPLFNDIGKVIEDLFDKGEEMSQKNVFKSIFYSLPEVNLNANTRNKCELPDVSVKWVLLQNLPAALTDDELMTHMKEKGKIERLVMLNKNTPQVCALVKFPEVRDLANVVKHLRTNALPGATAGIKIMRYSGKLASKTHEYNVNDYLKDSVKKGKKRKNSGPLGNEQSPNKKAFTGTQPHQSNQNPAIGKKPAAGQLSAQEKRDKLREKRLRQRQNRRERDQQAENPNSGQRNNLSGQHQMSPKGSANNQGKVVGRFASMTGNKAQPGGPVQKQQNAQGGGQSKTVYLSHMPPGTTHNQVMISMSQYGHVEHIEVSHTGKTCTVQMKTPQQARSAVNGYNGKVVPGGSLPVSASLQEPPRTGPSAQKKESGPQMKGAGPQMRGAGPQMKGGGPQMRGPGPQMRGGGPQMRGPGPQKKGPAHQMKGAGPQKRGPGAQRELELNHLPPGTTKDQVMVSMSQYGEVEHVEPSRSGKSCVVRMRNPQHARNAVNGYNGQMLPGCSVPITATLGGPKMTGMGPQSKGPGPQNKRQGPQVQGSRPQMKGSGPQMKQTGPQRQTRHDNMNRRNTGRPYPDNSPSKIRAYGQQPGGADTRFDHHRDMWNSPFSQDSFSSRHSHSQFSSPHTERGERGYSYRDPEPSMNSHRQFSSPYTESPMDQFYRDPEPETDFSPMAQLREAKRIMHSTPKIDHTRPDQMKTVLLSMSTVMAKNLQKQEGMRQQKTNLGQQDSTVEVLQKQVENLKRQQEQLQEMLQQQMSQTQAIMPSGGSDYNYQQSSYDQDYSYSAGGQNYDERDSNYPPVYPPYAYNQNFY